MADGSSKSSRTSRKRPPGAKELRDRISSLEQEVSSLTSAKEASEDRAFGLTHRLATLESRERELSELLANRREQIARLETERDMLNRLLGEERERVGIAEGREREVRDVSGELRESLAALRGERDLLGQSLEESREALAALRGERDLLEQGLEESRESLAALSGERDLLERRLEERREPSPEQRQAESRVSALEGELAEAKEAMEGAMERAERADGARDALRRDLERAEARYRRVHGRIEELQASKSYRIMRWLWRVNARIRNPFGRRRGEGEAKAEAAKAPASSPARLASAKPTTGSAKPAAAKAEKPRSEPAKAAPAPDAADSTEVRAEVRERRMEAAARVPLEVGELRVAAVVDEISRACLEPDCDLLSFGSEGWEERLEVHQPHLLLVESAWQGNDGSWQYQVASYDHPDYVGLPALKKLITWCRANGVPTVFWNKEDPVHFERFREAARLFDHVFTTDSNRIPDYEALDREGSGGVHSLQFAAQPRIHNPIAVGPRADSPCFAGAYYRDRHVDRRASLEMLLDAAEPFGLVIYDRTAGSEDDAFGFPERFRPSIRGRLPYAEMIDAYKSHKVFLNVNSVTDSPTMLSRRVFELLACETAVVSTESMGVSETFGELVPIVESPEQAAETIERLIGDDEFRRDLTARGRRHVLSRHTYRDRLASIASAAGYAVSEREAGVAAIALVDEMPQARKMRELVADISGQSLPPAELLIGVGAERPLVGDLQQLSSGDSALRVRIVAQEDGASRPERYRELGALAESPWVAVLHPQHEYGEHHVRDLLLATGYTRAEVIGSASFELLSGEESLRPELEGRFVELVHPHSALLRRDLVAAHGWPDELPAAWETLRTWFEQGVRFFSVASPGFRADAALGRPPRIAAAASSELG